MATTTGILGVARNTFREAVRDRIFLVVAVFGLVILVSSFIVGPLSLGEQQRITKDIGLAGISVLSFVVAILIGTGIVYREIERKTIYTVVSKPVRRWQFITGKFLGLSATVALIVGGMTAVLVVIDGLVGGGGGLGLMKAVLLIWMELVLLTSLSIMMSTLCSPILGAVFSLTLYVIGHTSAGIKDLASRFGSDSARMVAKVIYYSLPNLEYMNVRSKVIHGVHIDARYIVFACSYALLYSLVFLVIAVLVFERKEFR